MTVTDPMIRLREASALMRQGRAGEAAEIFAEIARANPRQPELQNNLGVALKAAGRLKEAAQAYRRALKLAPDYAVAEGNLARVLGALGDGSGAVRHFESAHGRAPDAGYLADMLDVLAGLRFQSPDAKMKAVMSGLFARRDIDLQRLAPAALSLVIANRTYARGADMAWRWLRGGGESPPPLPDDPLLGQLLVWTTLPDPRLEAWMTAERRRLLLEGRGSVKAEKLAALALQAMTAEHAWMEAADETSAVDALLSQDALSLEEALLIAFYRDLANVPAAIKALRDSAKDGMTMLVLERAITEPDAEKPLAATLPALTPMGEDTISERVRDQYETHPYPRWRTV
ncbi:MAG: tetratricopeptide repeat protein, partial [Nisaea sp.]